MFAQDKWTIKRATINAGPALGLVHQRDRPGERCRPAPSTRRATYAECPDGKNNLDARLRRDGSQNWKDITPRVGVAYDLFGNGRTALKAASRATSTAAARGRQHHRQQQPGDDGRPDGHARRGRDLDGNGSPFDAAGNIQLNELTDSTSTPNFGRNVADDAPDRSRRCSKAGARAATTGNTPSARSTSCCRASRSTAAGTAASSATRPSPSISATASQEQLRWPVLHQRAGRSEPARTAAATRSAASTI